MFKIYHLFAVNIGTLRQIHVQQKKQSILHAHFQMALLQSLMNAQLTLDLLAYMEFVIVLIQASKLFLLQNFNIFSTIKYSKL